MEDTREKLLRELREEHAALEREHQRLQREVPVDLASHSEHAQKLKKHKERLQAFTEALRREEASNDQ